MRRTVVTMVLVTGLLAACSSAGASPATPSASSHPIDAATQKADAALILTMYADIDAAFARSPAAGVRALLAAQYPADLADVDPARCVRDLSYPATPSPTSSSTRGAASRRATTTPSTQAKAKAQLRRMTYSPNIATMAADPHFVLNSDKVKQLKPMGRIYVTDIVITDGRKPTVHARHQVVLDGRAYQFTSC